MTYNCEKKLSRSKHLFKLTSQIQRHDHMPPVAGSKAVCGYDGVPERQLRHPLDLFLCGAPVKNLKKESQWRRPQSTAWKPKTRQMKKK